MTNNERNSSYRASTKYIDFLSAVLRDNDRFLHENAKDVYDEVIELILDTVDYVRFFVKREGWKEEYVRFSMVNFVHHILMPFSYAIYVDFLAANLVACFMELRFMLESLVKCYWADVRYSEQTFFQNKLALLKKDFPGTAKLMQKSGKDFVTLWGKLSEQWVHTKGVVDRMVLEIAEKSDVPAWALVVPVGYTETDIDVLVELQKRIFQFRVLLKETIEKWKTNHFDSLPPARNSSNF